MMKLLVLAIGLLFIGIGIRSIVKKEATWSRKRGEHEFRQFDSPHPDEIKTHHTGPVAVLIGIVEIIIGIAILGSGVK
jgi:uncharacterized membrane protein YkgB